MRTFLLMSTTSVVLLAAMEATAEPVLLASFRAVGDPGQAPTTVPAVRFDLELRPNDVNPPGPRLVDAMFRGEGEIGTVDFTRDNSSAFDDFANLATNGIDDHYGQGFRWFDGGGGIAGGPEMRLFNQFSTVPVDPPDLAGNELEIVRLIVHSISFDPWTPFPGEDGFIVNFDLTYEFYGSPIPEPRTLGLVVLGALIVRWRARGVNCLEAA